MRGKNLCQPLNLKLGLFDSHMQLVSLLKDFFQGPFYLVVTGKLLLKFKPFGPGIKLDNRGVGDEEEKKRGKDIFTVHTCLLWTMCRSQQRLSKSLANSKGQESDKRCRLGPLKEIIRDNKVVALCLFAERSYFGG